MEAVRFFTKVLAITFLFILVLQVRWDRATLEEHMMIFMTESAVSAPINNAATGIVKFARNSWNTVLNSIDTNFTNRLKSDNRPGQRHTRFNVERSKEYLKERANEAREVASDGYDYAREKIREKGKRFGDHLRREGVIEDPTNDKSVER